MTEELKQLFDEKLNLNLLSVDTQKYFYDVFERYMKHGRTCEFIATNLDILLYFFDAIGINRVEAVIVLANDPSLLNNVRELYNKYLFLGILENDENSFRRHKFFSKTKDYRVSLDKMYSRYKMCLECGYSDIKWNTLVHATDNEFAKIFIEGTYKKSYQLFSSLDQVMKFLEELDVSDFDIEEYKKLPVNEELVARYEEKGRKY